MLKRKKPSEKGKFSFSQYFQKFKEGDSVAVVRELSIPIGYSKRLQGKTGKVIGKQGNAYHVEIKDLNKMKKYFIKPIHLKRIQEVK
jgi:large subunit ribosomal protein L21e